MKNALLNKLSFMLALILASSLTANADVTLNKRAMQPIDAAVAPSAAATAVTPAGTASPSNTLPPLPKMTTSPNAVVTQPAQLPTIATPAANPLPRVSTSASPDQLVGVKPDISAMVDETKILQREVKQLKAELAALKAAYAVHTHTVKVPNYGITTQELSKKSGATTYLVPGGGSWPINSGTPVTAPANN